MCQCDFSVRISFIVTQKNSNKTSMLAFKVLLTLSLPILLSRRGKSTRRKHVHLQYPLTDSVDNFPFSNEATTSSLHFPCLSETLFLFFPSVASLGCGFSLLSEHRKCVVAKQVPVTVSTPHRATELNLTPITRSQLPKIFTSTFTRV